MVFNKIIKKVVSSSLIAAMGTLSMGAIVPWSLLADSEEEYSVQSASSRRGSGDDFHHGRRHRAFQFLDLTEEQEALIQSIHEAHQAVPRCAAYRYEAFETTLA